MAIHEVASIAAFLAVLAWALRSRNPVNLGALLGGFMIFGFDWWWCSKGFFNATFAPTLTMIPGIHVLGEQYPLAMACNWAISFGFGPLLLSRFHGPIGRALGRLHLPVIFAACALTDMLLEAFLISGLGIYKYHQAPEFLLWGVIWSNSWFLGGVLTLSYFGLASVQAGFALGSETTWKGLSLSAGAIWSSAFFLTVLQLFWYAAATPWVESGRQF